MLLQVGLNDRIDRSHRGDLALIKEEPPVAKAAQGDEVVADKEDRAPFAGDLRHLPETLLLKAKVPDSEDLVENLVVSLNDPVVVFHVKLSDIPTECDRLSLYEELLRLNASEMLHGAYGITGNAIVATDTLQAENLDFNEFQASVDALNLAITSHYKRILGFLKTDKPRS